MTFLRARRGFSLLELMIALSILIIMTGAASYYLGDILFKAKVAKAKNDMETIAGAITLNDAENPTQLLDTGLVGTSATGQIGGANGPSVTERQTISNLVGSYLLTTVNDPWQTSYKVNSYTGYVKTYASDYQIAGTSKYDKDIVTYYLPENLFLAKVRADDMNANTYLDTGDEIILYFSKSVRCNVHDESTGNTPNRIAYDGTAQAANETPYGIEVLDVHYAPVGSATTIAVEEAQIDNNGVTEAFNAGGQSDNITVAPGDANLVSWTAHDLWAFRPGGQDAGIAAQRSCNDEMLLLGEAGGIEGDANLANRNGYGFHRPGDVIFYASCFSRKLKFWCPQVSVSHGGDSLNLDIGYEVYIPTLGSTTDHDAGATGGHKAFSEGYAIWESSKGYTAYKTLGERKKIYLMEQNEAQGKRALVWKSIVD